MVGIQSMLMACLDPKPIFIASEVANVVTSATLIINKPAGVVSGMLLVAFMSSNDGAAASWSGDAGWTERADQGSEPYFRCATLVAGGAEPASYTFTYSIVANKLSGFILAFTNAAYNNIGAFGTSTSGDPVVAPSTTLSKTGALLAAYTVNNNNSTFTSPTGMVLIAEYLAASPSISIFMQEVPIGATGTRTSDPSVGSGKSAGILVGMI